MEGVVADVSGCSRETLLLQWRKSDHGILKEVDIPFPNPSLHCVETECSVCNLLTATTNSTAMLH